MVAKKMLPVKTKRSDVGIGTAVKFGDKMKAKARIKNYIGQDVPEMAAINRGGNKSGVTKGKYLPAIKRRLKQSAEEKGEKPLSPKAERKEESIEAAKMRTKKATR